MQQLEPCIPLAHALLPLVKKSYDPVMNDPVTYLGAFNKDLEENVPIIRALHDLGAQPEEMPEVHAFIKRLPNYKNVTPSLDSFRKQYREWKAWKAQQDKPRPAPAQRPAQKVLPVVQSAEERQRAADTLAAMQAARLSQPT